MSSEIFPLDYSCMGHSVIAVIMQFFLFCAHMLAYVLSTGDRSSLPFLSPHGVCKMHPWKTWNFSMRNSSDSTWNYETWCRHRNQVCTSRLCSIWDGRGGTWKIRWIAGLYSQFQWHSGWLYRLLQEYKRFENLLPRSPPVSIIFLLLLEGRSYFSYIVRPRMDCHHAPHEERSFSSELWSSLKSFFSHQYSVISLCKICVSAFLCTGKFHVPAFHLKIHEEIHASLACWSVNVWSRIPKPSSCVFIVPSHGDVSVRKSSFVAQDAVFLPPWFSNFKVSRKRKKRWLETKRSFANHQGHLDNIRPIGPYPCLETWLGNALISLHLVIQRCQQRVGHSRHTFRLWPRAVSSMVVRDLRGPGRFWGLAGLGFFIKLLSFVTCETVVWYVIRANGQWSCVLMSEIAFKIFCQPTLNLHIINPACSKARGAAFLLNLWVIFLFILDNLMQCKDVMILRP